MVSCDEGGTTGSWKGCNSRGCFSTRSARYVCVPEEGCWSKYWVSIYPTFVLERALFIAILLLFQGKRESSFAPTRPQPMPKSPLLHAISSSRHIFRAAFCSSAPKLSLPRRKAENFHGPCSALDTHQTTQTTTISTNFSDPVRARDTNSFQACQFLNSIFRVVVMARLSAQGLQTPAAQQFSAPNLIAAPPLHRYRSVGG